MFKTIQHLKISIWYFLDLIVASVSDTRQVTRAPVYPEMQ